MTAAARPIRLVVHTGIPGPGSSWTIPYGRRIVYFFFGRPYRSKVALFGKPVFSVTKLSFFCKLLTYFSYIVAV